MCFYIIKFNIRKLLQTVLKKAGRNTSLATFLNKNKTKAGLTAAADNVTFTC